MMLFQRRIFLELMGNALTTIMLLATVLMLITSVQVLQVVEGLSLFVFAKSVPIFVAAALDIVLPMSVLVAVVLTYGRAAADNEVDTLRASGVHPLHLLTPGLVFGLLMTAVLLVGMDYGKPYAERAKRRITKDVDVAALLAQKLASGEPEWLEEGRTLISAGDIDENGDFRDLRLTFFDAEGHVERAIVAERAKAYVDPDRYSLVLELKKFRTVVGPRIEGDDVTTIEKSLVRTDVDLNIRSMTTPQLLAWLQYDPSYRGSFTEARVRTEVDMRFAASAVCFVFVLLGLPVALWFRRQDRVGAFLVAFVLALFLYYPSIKISKALADKEVLTPAAASWSGHALLLLVSLLLFWRVFRR